MAAERPSERKARVDEELRILFDQYEKDFSSAHRYKFIRKIGSGSNPPGLLFENPSRENHGVKFAFSPYLQANNTVEN